jgi:hypothetical protein
MLKAYSDFLDYVNKAGIMAFSGRFIDGFPKLDALTSPVQWHTGDRETDPWLWKDRAATEKCLAFGNILGGRKGFIAESLYPLFYSACRPDGTPEDRYRDGTIKKTVLDVYRLFEAGDDLDTSEIRKKLHVTKKDGASAVDAAVAALQREFYITVCGNRRKVSFDGQEYGWPANVYRLVDDWAADWLTAPLLPTQTARARVLDHCAALDERIDIQALEKLLFGKLF